MRPIKKRIFLQKLPDTTCVRQGEKRAFSCTRSVLAKSFFEKNSETRKNYKNSGFSAKCPKAKMTPFFEKVFSDMGEDWVLPTVFLKSCVLLKTLFLVFSAKHSSCKKNVC